MIILMTKVKELREERRAASQVIKVKLSQPLMRETLIIITDMLRQCKTGRHHTIDITT